MSFVHNLSSLAYDPDNETERYFAESYTPNDALLYTIKY